MPPLKDYELSGHSGAESITPPGQDRNSSSSPAAELPEWHEGFRPAKICKVCGKLLGLRDRKVHRGDCARTRENQMQRERRARNRR